MAKVQIRPGVGLLSLFPAMNYKPWFALGEMVDNSIQSYVTHRESLRKLHGNDFKLRIDINFSSGSDPRIVVEDNAAGIMEVDIERAFTPAARPYDRSGISQFGIGMKSSATWYSNFYVISSSALGENVKRTVTFDIEKIIAEEIEELEILSEPKDVSVHGTRIVMSQLHQGIPTGATLGKIRSFITSIYREFLKSGEIIISVGDEALKYTAPALLEEKYWDDKGPVESSPKSLWQIPIDIILDESWERDQAPNKPSSPPRVRGWMGILKEGSTKLSGAALIWRKKVVVGAGSLAQGDEDSYRPGSIFGASTTFPFQRLIGEIDLSELQVTTFKDQIDWRDGQENELQMKLRAAIEHGEYPLLKMARNYRSTARTSQAQDVVKRSVDETTAALKTLLSDKTIMEFSSGLKSDVPATSSNVSDIVQSEIKLPLDDNSTLVFMVVVEPGDSKLFRLSMTDDGGFAFSVNRAHPFMNSFANLPGADLDPILRMASALGIAEILGRNAALDHPDYIRNKMNEILSGAMSLKNES
ncbi:HATPase domain containing protein [Candidatus Nanopelagicaceae bacterium]